VVSSPKLVAAVVLVAAALAAAMGCGGGTTASSSDGGSPEGSSGSSGSSGDGGDASPGDGSAPDGADAFVCATSPNSSANEGCNCGIGTAPVTGPEVATCPAIDVPFLCVTFDVPEGMGEPARHECECRVKCAQQSSSSASSGGPGPTMCACGAATFLPLGGEGVSTTAVATCALTTCCKGEGACDCSDSPSFVCRPAQTAVPSCTPADYDEDNTLAIHIPPGTYENVTKVTRCK
jgi:hypothetical protein